MSLKVFDDFFYSILEVVGGEVAHAV